MKISTSFLVLLPITTFAISAAELTKVEKFQKFARDHANGDPLPQSKHKDVLERLHGSSSLSTFSVGYSEKAILSHPHKAYANKKWRRYDERKLLTVNKKSDRKLQFQECKPKSMKASKSAKSSRSDGRRRLDSSTTTRRKLTKSSSRADPADQCYMECVQFGLDEAFCRNSCRGSSGSKSSSKKSKSDSSFRQDEQHCVYECIMASKEMDETFCKESCSFCLSTQDFDVDEYDSCFLGCMCDQFDQEGIEKHPDYEDFCVFPLEECNNNCPEKLAPYPSDGCEDICDNCVEVCGGVHDMNNPLMNPEGPLCTYTCICYELEQDDNISPKADDMGCSATQDQCLEEFEMRHTFAAIKYDFEKEPVPEGVCSAEHLFCFGQCDVVLDNFIYDLIEELYLSGIEISDDPSEEEFFGYLHDLYVGIYLFGYELQVLSLEEFEYFVSLVLFCSALFCSLPRHDASSSHG